MKMQLKPRSGSILRVLGIVRTSTARTETPEDQKATLRRFLAERYDGPVGWKFIASRKPSLDEDDLAEAQEAVEASCFDVVACVDLTRISRGSALLPFCQHCQDHGVGLISVCDMLNSQRPN